MDPKLILTGDFERLETKIKYVECGGYHTAAIDTEGTLYMWGRSDVGQLGIPKE
jgi:alpha-tubulin suppressor-like RCC1 family protein